MRIFPKTISSLLLFPTLVLAQTDFSQPKQVLRTIIKIGSLMGQFLMAVSVIIILYAGFQYITAAGNEEKVSDATRTLTYAIIGMIVGLLAFSIPPILTQFFQ